MFHSQANDGITPHLNYETHVGHVRFGRRSRSATSQRGGNYPGVDVEPFDLNVPGFENLSPADFELDDIDENFNNFPVPEVAPNDGILIPPRPIDFEDNEQDADDVRDSRLTRRDRIRYGEAQRVRNNVYYPRLLSNNERLRKFHGHKMYKCKIKGYNARRRKCDDDGNNCSVKTVPIRGHVGYRANCKPEHRMRR